MTKTTARKATKKAPKISPELQYLAELVTPPTAKEMIEAIEDEAEGWIESNTQPVGDINTMDVGLVRSVIVLRAAAEFIRQHAA